MIIHHTCGPMTHDTEGAGGDGHNGPLGGVGGKEIYFSYYGSVFGFMYVISS